MISLLDVNVLVAIAWPNHIHNNAARKWFREHRQDGWATCAATENGFIRVSSNIRIIPEAKSPREAALLLKDLTALKNHFFWPEEASIIDERWIGLDKIHTYRQITDAHLLSLALRNGGRLATLDRGILNLLPEGIELENAIQLIPYV